MTDEQQGQPETELPVKLSEDTVEDLAPGEESKDVAGGIIAVLHPLLPAV